jgi:hypothetical protein
MGRQWPCGGVAINSGFTVRPGDCLVWPVGLPHHPLIAITSRVPFARGPAAVAAGVTQLRESNAWATPD